MGANDAVHDEVAAKIAAHNAAILKDISQPRRRRAVATKPRARKGKPLIDGEQRLFGAGIGRVESFGQTRKRNEYPILEPRVPVPSVRQREIRCLDCDRRLVVRSDRVICPKCGAIFGDAPTLRKLRDAFPGMTIENPDCDA